MSMGMTRNLHRRGLAAPLVLLAALTLPARAETDRAAPPGEEDRLELDEAKREAERLLRWFGGEAEAILRGLGKDISALPRYGAPRVLPNGDILIPRLPDPDPAPPQDAPADAPRDGGERIDL